MANISKYRKSEILREEVEALGENVAVLEARHQNTSQEVSDAKSTLVAEEKELHRLEAELEKAKTRHMEAKRAPEKIEAEGLETGRELKRKRELLVLKRSMLGDYEGQRFDD